MKKFPSIHSNDDFQSVYKNGKSKANKYLIVYIKESYKNRLGISVSKKIGNSVIRHNRARLIREIFRKNLSLYKEDKFYDVVVIFRKESSDIDYNKLNFEYNNLLKLHGILKNEENINKIN